MSYIKEVARELRELCGICALESCCGCKISVKIENKAILINGETKEIEKIESIPNFA